jgi:hypothetical protein
MVGEGRPSTTLLASGKVVDDRPAPVMTVRQAALASTAPQASNTENSLA